MNKPASYSKLNPRLLEEMEKILSNHQTGPAYEKLKARLLEDIKNTNEPPLINNNS
jgi:hypothetical protein